MRQENILESIVEGSCVKCPSPIEAEEVWRGLSLYKEAICPQCQYVHVLFVKKA